VRQGDSKKSLQLMATAHGFAEGPKQRHQRTADHHEVPQRSKRQRASEDVEAKVQDAQCTDEGSSQGWFSPCRLVAQQVGLHGILIGSAAHRLRAALLPPNLGCWLLYVGFVEPGRQQRQ
jgi:hypothetical protein